MIYRPRKMNFREVLRADTFHVDLTIGPAYELTPDTSIVMEVRPTGDIPQAPILVFSTSNETITATGQVITLHQDKPAMQVQTGRFVYDIQFTKDNITTTLCKGLFEIIDDATLV